MAPTSANWSTCCKKLAEQTGLVAAVGQDAVQAIIAAPFAMARVEPEKAPPLQAEWDPQTLAHQYRTAQATVDAFWYITQLEDKGSSQSGWRSIGWMFRIFTNFGSSNVQQRSQRFCRQWHYHAG